MSAPVPSSDGPSSGAASSGGPSSGAASSAGPPAAGEATVYVGMGSNVGDRLGHLQAALDRLDAVPGVRVVAASPVLETEAHVRPGAPPQPDHLNAVAALATTLAPHALLDRLRAAEDAAGRDRTAPPWSARPLDLDVLVWGARVLRTGRLQVPHPRLAQRRFVLAPLAALVPDLVVPGHGRAADLLAATPDRSRVAPYDGALTLPGGARGAP